MRIARVSGIPIRLHWSFLALMAVYAVASFVTGGATGLADTAALSTALFGSVLLHELGHALAARRYGVDTAHITLFPFGGVAAIVGMPSRPSQELVVALAGPLVNFAIVVVAGAAWAITGWMPILYIAALNLLMGTFNLIPAFPMDGGRVLRAALAGPLGFVQASRIAMVVGRVFAWLFLAVGAIWFTPGLLMVGLFLHVAIAAERRRLEWTIRQAAHEARRRRYVRPMAVERPVYAARLRLSEP